MSPNASLLEIEQKFRVENHDEVIGILEARKASKMPIENHRDLYFRHPCRNFSKTGEAFRIRYVNEQVVVTYKGAKEPGPVKTRLEIELPLADSTADGWLTILQRLGFTIASEVTKVRQAYQLQDEDLSIVVACDRVDRLGNFVEVESIVSEREHIVETQQAIQNLAHALGLREIETKSYLRQILELNQDLA